MTAKKPEGYRQFEDLTKKLLSVPRRDLDRERARYNAERAARKKQQGKSKP